MYQVRNWFCAQLGGREHYAIPRALNAAGALRRVMTDYWAGPPTRRLTSYVSNKAARSLAARFHADLPGGIVKSWNLRALIWEAQARRMALNGGVAGQYLGYCEVGKHFSGSVSRFIKSQDRLPENSVFFGYDTCSLEVMEQLKERGVACILDQIDPCRVEVEMVQEEQQLWPGWQNHALDVPEEFYERHIQEWTLADRIVVNSEFSRGALIMQGVPGGKIAVIPLCYEQPELVMGRDQQMRDVTRHIAANHFSRETPLRVLFLGQVMLRKGIQYLAQSAELLRDYPVVFDIVGPLHISDKAVESAPSNMRFHGRAIRSEIIQWYRRSHVFVLPTLSDGFAITQLEAMANGLPVIATPNCGAVVSDAVDGFLVPPRDPESIARVISRYLDEPEILENHHLAALQKSKQFSLDRVGTDLLTLAQEIHCHSCSPKRHV